MTNIYSPSFLKQLLKEYKIFPSKKLGQSFLICPEIAQKVVNSALLQKGDLVLEVGPGFGALTRILLERGCQVIAVEKDRRLFQFLEDYFSKNSHFHLICDDVLNFLENFQEKNYKIVASLPYPITSYFLRQIMEKENKPSLAVFIVQWEVGQKICARPPQMNLISVICQIFAKPQLLGKVTASCFYPKPKVDSAILKFSDFQNPFKTRQEEKNFLEFLKIGFSQKRKLLKSNLAKGLDIGEEKIEKAFKVLKINPKVRAEALTTQQWLDLYYLLLT